MYLDVFVIFLIISQFLTLIYMSLQFIFIMQKIILPHPIPMHTQFFLHFKFVLKLSYAIYQFFLFRHCCIFFGQRNTTIIICVQYTHFHSSGRHVVCNMHKHQNVYYTLFFWLIVSPRGYHLPSCPHFEFINIYQT